MASRSEITSQIAELIGEGKVRDAYKQFEELPVLDQIAVGISPGVEVLDEFDQLHPNFAARFGGGQSKINLDDFDDYLSSKGNKYGVTEVAEEFQPGLVQERLFDGYGNVSGAPRNTLIERNQRIHTHKDMKESMKLIKPDGGYHYGRGASTATPNEISSIGFDEVSKYNYDFNTPFQIEDIEIPGLGAIEGAPEWLQGSKKVYHLHRVLQKKQKLKMILNLCKRT